MEITEKIFREVIDLSLVHKAGMHKIDNVVSRVAKFYCRPMTMANNCPQECSLCKKRIEEQLKRIDVAKAKSTYAIFTWQLRNMHSRYAEAKKIEPQFKKNAFGENVETDLFAMLEGYG